jgi:CBS domain-containing protein
MYRARDVMSTNVYTISPDATVEEAIRLLINRNVSGMPVVVEEGKLVGVISEYQLLEAIYTTDVMKMPVGEFATKDVMSVRENALLSDVANLFILNRIRRVPVVRDDRVVGVISRRDLLRYILDAGESLGEFLGQVTCGA